MIIKWFQKKEDVSPDQIGAYPERMQVRALPERRFLKTSRLLAVLTIMSIAVLFMLGTFFIYLTDHADVTFSGRNYPRIYSINYETKRLEAPEYYTKNVSVAYLLNESNLRNYIKQRHTIVWDDVSMRNRWGASGWLSMATSDILWEALQPALNYELGRSRASKYVRDVHIYDLKNISGNLWEGTIELFDMPIPDMFNPICQCEDNSKECINCKREKGIKQRRYKLYARTSLSRPQTMTNPYGFSVDGYHLLYMPQQPTSEIWDLPRVLKPEL